MGALKNKRKNTVSTVCLYDGTTANKEDAFYFNGEYFLKTHPGAVIDFISDEYILADKSHQIPASFNTTGYPDTKVSVFTTKNFIENFPLVFLKGDLIPFYDSEKLIENGYKECLESGVFFHPNDAALAKHSKTGIYRKCNLISLKNTDDPIRKMDLGIRSPSYKLTNGKRYSFGVELETCSGFLPAYLDRYLNYEAVHDGSLRDSDGNVNGGEYVTGVLTGDMGFKQLKRLVRELNKRCLVNKQCGVHVHIGDVDFNKEFIVTLYSLAISLQNEIFSILPYSRRNNIYCRKLPNLYTQYDSTRILKNSYEYNLFLEDYYEQILLYVSHKNVLDPAVINKKNNHPLGSKCGYNHSTARYSWLNLVPTMFNTRRNGVYTVEFRPFNGSTNYIKIRNWILICMGIIYVVENYKREILSGNITCLKQIIDISYKESMAKELNDFVSKRKDLFASKDTNTEADEYVEGVVDNSLKFKDL